MKHLTSDALPFMLVILDGFGHQEALKGNAVAHASLPTWNHLTSLYPHTLLHASGHYVGLPEGFCGNSEVGHLTIGAGKPIPNLLKKIHDSIDDLSFFKKEALLTALHQIVECNGRLHLMGLLSDGGVHSHEKHLHALMKLAKEQNISELFLHIFTDGRDVSPRSASRFLERLETESAKLNIGVIASIHGRFYAMDRDQNKERTLESYKVLTHPDKTHSSWRNYLATCYHQKRLYGQYLA